MLTTNAATAELGRRLALDSDEPSRRRIEQLLDSIGRVPVDARQHGPVPVTTVVG